MVRQYPLKRIDKIGLVYCLKNHPGLLLDCLPFSTNPLSDNCDNVTAIKPNRHSGEPIARCIAFCATLSVAGIRVDTVVSNAVYIIHADLPPC